MPFNEALAERIRQGLAHRKNIEEKKMFGGIGFLLNGNLLVGSVEGIADRQTRPRGRRGGVA